jgi:WD40 repeat protein
MADGTGLESALGFIAISVFLGALGLATFVFFSLRNRSPRNGDQSKSKETKDSLDQKAQNGKKLLTKGSSKKKNSNNIKSHKTHFAILKGHTDQVYDLDFSMNGKHLASCSQGYVQTSVILIFIVLLFYDFLSFMNL